MSYCRWSTDDFACDLYCYEDVRGGYTTHVAGNRALGDIPKLPAELSADNAEVFSDTLNAQCKFLDACEREDITLPHAGETFNDPTLETFRARLVSLRDLGYHFPDSVLEKIDQKIGVRDAAR